MAHGHKTGGRQKGTPNKTTAERMAEIAAGGELPLDYMLRIMREAGDEKRRDAMASAAAPYVHPRLASVEQGGKDGGPIVVKIVD